jgi:hypothetical protein
MNVHKILLKFTKIRIILQKFKAWYEKRNETKRKNEKKFRNESKR